MMEPATAGRPVRARVAVFLVVCAVAAGASATYVRGVARRAASAAGPAGGLEPSSTGQGGQASAPEIRLDGDLAATVAQPHLLMVEDSRGADFERLTAAGVEPQGQARAPTPLTCKRVDFAGGRGVCLVNDRRSAKHQAVVFGQDFRPVARFPLEGLPSRVRVSPDGRLAATTTFVDGDSYNAESFSTRTLLLDLEQGRVLTDLERFRVTRAGRAFHPIDRNFWGVTFTPDSRSFYATMRTGPHYYLVRGDVATRRAQVLRDGVECPSLSPDGRLIVYKSRIEHGFDPATWQLRVLDTVTLADKPLAETRTVDDQAEWLDHAQVLYAVTEKAPGRALNHVWAANADGTGVPRLFAPSATSPVAVG